MKAWVSEQSDGVRIRVNGGAYISGADMIAAGYKKRGLTDRELEGILLLLLVSKLPLWTRNKHRDANASVFGLGHRIGGIFFLEKDFLS